MTKDTHGCAVRLGTPVLSSVTRCRPTDRAATRPDNVALDGLYVSLCYEYLCLPVTLSRYDRPILDSIREPRSQSRYDAEPTFFFTDGSVLFLEGHERPAYSAQICIESYEKREWTIRDAAAGRGKRRRRRKNSF